MLLRCCFIHITTIILRHIFHLEDVGPCLGLGQFMLCLCDLFFIFDLILIVINYITSLKQMHLLFFVHILDYLLLFMEDNVDEERE